MKYYKDKVGNIYAFESDGSQDAFIAPDLTLLDAAGLAAARAAQAAVNAPTPEQVLAAANTRRDSLLAVAALRIAPLQYAVDLNTATDAETKNLMTWKQYSVDINRVSEQIGFPLTIAWPVQPS
ncbi:tail fiber assembly protein [Pseudomonas sp. 1912-s]|jgi:hypothetical protein|uniref:tail fiber assembly protein n=1 Tax=Pseudomonas sp. 1912-s TaxID=3033802 RepID=UPI0023E040B4|nr:tail fiber assembly protein [Pseudomonas sp. 1912-s]MDF3201867.1 tail fiber assembly protein [Pseudomonas sp. 1912-s]